MDYINNIDGVTTVYLNTSVKELSKRLFEAESDRPLLQHLNSMEEFQEFVGKHLFERSVFYNKAHHSVSTDRKSIEEVATEIKSSLA
jgi:shikimate kinase